MPANALCEKCAWDSDFFGFPIGRVIPRSIAPSVGPKVMDWARTNGIRCLYFLCDPSAIPSIEWAESNRFHLVDIRMTLSWTAGSLPPSETFEGVRVRKATPADREPLTIIADHNYGITRFACDRNFDPKKANELYITWVNRSFDGFADDVFVIEKEGHPAGFVTFSNSGEGQKRIGLFGVSKEFQDEGLGRQLLRSALDIVSAEGCRQIEVVTQGRNISAQRLYQSKGFRTTDVGLWYHRWF